MQKEVFDFVAKPQERAISLQIGYMVAVVSQYVATHSYLPTQPLNLWVMVCMKQKLLKCALYVSPQVCTTYSKQRCTRAMVVRLDGNKKYTYVIEWSEKHTAFLARCIQTKTGLANLTPFVPIEVIGNIYDNPNLLKGENKSKAKE